MAASRRDVEKCSAAASGDAAADGAPYGDGDTTSRRRAPPVEKSRFSKGFTNAVSGYLASFRRDRGGAGRVADEVGRARRGDEHLADRETAPELEQPALRDEPVAAGPAQDVEAQVRRDRERHGADIGQDRRVEREIGECHHRRTRDSAAGPQEARVRVEPHPCRERADPLPSGRSTRPRSSAGTRAPGNRGFP